MITDESVREIRINLIVPTESVLVATAHELRPQQQEERIRMMTVSAVRSARVPRYRPVLNWDRGCL